MLHMMYSSQLLYEIFNPYTNEAIKVELNKQNTHRSGMHLDYKSSHLLENTYNTVAPLRSRFFNRANSRNTRPLGAVRIQTHQTPEQKKNYLQNKGFAIATLLVLGVFIATVSSGHVEGQQQSQNAPLLMDGYSQQPTNEPDFYFIESSQFVPGTHQLQLAAYKPESKVSEVINPWKALRADVSPPDMDIKLGSIKKELTDLGTPEHYDKMIIVKSGDTLSEIMVEQGIEPSSLHAFLKLDVIKEYLATLHTNQEFSIRRKLDGHFVSFTMKIGSDKKLVVVRDKSGFSGSIIKLAATRHLQMAAAEIESSLFIAGQNAGLSQKTIMNLVDIYQWDVDFGTDIRKGDKFKIIYEKFYRDGKLIGVGDIVAAEFNSRSRAITAIRYKDLNGRTSYYTPDGRSMRKAFLRNPVDIVRVTSHFNPNRKHPVLHTIRAHKGTDYGAPKGTPIRSTGDGKIIFVGTKGGYGKTVILKHGDKYTTLYAHMSKFAKDIKPGKRIQQGQIIGHVGQTGRVSGTHLHYEFRINGRHKNPLKVKLPGARPLPNRYRADFLSKSREALALLDELNPIAIATR